MTKRIKKTITKLTAIAMFGVGAAVAWGVGHCPADLNGDSVVDSADFGIVVAALGDVGPSSADIDGDGVVGQSDLAILLTYFGSLNCTNIAGPGTVTHTAVRVDNSSVRLGDDALEPFFDGGVSHFTFEFSVGVAGSNIWTTSSMDTTILPGASYEINQHPIGTNIIQEALAEIVPAIVYDTAVLSPYGAASTSVPPLLVVSTPTDFDVFVWFTKGVPEAHEGLIARVSLVRTSAAPDPIIVPFGACPSAVRIGSIEITSTAGFTEGDLHTTVFEIIESPFFSDINGDLVVDTADLGIQIGKFGTDHPYSDLNNDGVVDTADLGALIGEFGQSCP